MGMTVAGLTLHDSIRVRKLIIETHERLAVRVITLYLCVHMIESIVVTTLTILCLMIDSTVLNLHLTSREVTLEVLHVRCRIPQAPLLEREEF